MAQRRRIVVRSDDVLVVGGLEVDAAVLAEIMDTSKRLLWCFVRNENGDVQPHAVSEEHCIWLVESDLVRK